MLYNVAGKWVKVPAEELRWSLDSGRGDLLGLSTDEKPAQIALEEAGRILHHVQCEHPLQQRGLYLSRHDKTDGVQTSARPSLNGLFLHTLSEGIRVVSFFRAISLIIPEEVKRPL